MAAGTVVLPAGYPGDFPVAAVKAPVLYPQRFEQPMPSAGKDWLTSHPGLCEKLHPWMFPNEIPVSSLGSRFCGGSYPEGLRFLKIGSGNLPLHHANRVDMPKVSMVIMHHRDKGHVSANETLHLTQGLSRDVLEVQIFEYIFFFGIEVEDEFEKERVLGGVNQLICVDFVTAVEGVEEFPRHSFPVFAPPVDDIAEMLLNHDGVSGVFHFDDGHGDCSS